MNWKDNFLKVAVPARVYDGTFYHDILIDPELESLIKKCAPWDRAFEINPVLTQPSDPDILPVDLGDESV